ncbi:hypothetical protein M413DRAFT_448753 [Hebeloma cylindrosporum]|uniref:CsbD-like domain-containing protein n=1 Tax=Hebeloma cylindrosporum TaxID=76867 RepID=A0A0C2Y7N0_HEBCY|nr:hypothetical protein M413DRAFT_448753 [Hebeloma cylindrosporum h7]
MYNTSTADTKPSKTAGTWHSTKGEIKEGLGRTFASADLERAGREERITGEAQRNAASSQGTGQRLAGQNVTAGSLGGGHAQQARPHATQATGDRVLGNNDYGSVGGAQTQQAGPYRTNDAVPSSAAHSSLGGAAPAQQTGHYGTLGSGVRVAGNNDAVPGSTGAAPSQQTRRPDIAYPNEGEMIHDANANRVV